MSNEELKKEAENESYKQGSCDMIGRAIYAKGYLAGAEPREKRIAELEKRLNEIELLCYTDGSDGEVLAKIMDYFAKENDE